MVLIILSFLGAAALIGMLVFVTVLGGGFVVDVWYSYVILGVIAALLIWYAFWRMEDEYCVFSNAKQRRAERRAARKSSANIKVKYRQPYRVEGADETYTEFETVRYLIRNCIDGQDRFVRFNTLIEGGYTPAMAWYGYIKVHGHYGYKVDKKLGLSWLRSAADKGCPVAHAYLYWLYIGGTKSGVKKNVKKALEHLEKALKVDHIIPLAYLAKGDECLRNDDLKEAKAWFEKAVAKNPNYGYYDLAWLTHRDKSISDALSGEMQLSYLEKAVTSGPVLYTLSYIYEEKGDHRRAFLYALEAAHMYDEAAQVRVGYYYYKGIGVKKDEGKTFEWNMEAAQHDDKEAQCNVGYCYQEGIGVEKNQAEAVKWYKKAAEQGNASAQCNLGICYDYGKGVERNYAEAAKWYKKAAEQGNATAQNNLGVCYEKGVGVERNYTEAVKWVRKSALQGYARAEDKLGYFYNKGMGVTRDVFEATKWLRKSANQGWANGQYNLGVCYAKGEGVAKSLYEAKKWYQKAAAQGHQEAKDALKKLG